MELTGPEIITGVILAAVYAAHVGLLFTIRVQDGKWPKWARDTWDGLNAAALSSLIFPIFGIALATMFWFVWWPVFAIWITVYIARANIKAEARV